MQVLVKLRPSTLLIRLGDKVILSGQLFSAIKQEDNMWLLQDRIIHLTMLKRNRRGNHANQCTNADTFWRSVMKHAPQQERLRMAYPPNKYYSLTIGDDLAVDEPRSSQQQQQDRSIVTAMQALEKQACNAS